ncbi:MAG: hypothetical protein IPK80_07210 [Nannocystis sp.]|nr:hypothetical protein [Nannocystis sp.]
MIRVEPPGILRSGVAPGLMMGGAGVDLGWRRDRFVRIFGDCARDHFLDGARIPRVEVPAPRFITDVLPQSAIESIELSRTWWVDTPGDQPCGSSRLASRDPPPTFLFQTDIYIGANTATTGRAGLIGDRFVGDHLAFGNLARQLPSSFNTAYPIDYTQQLTGSLDRVWTPADIERFGEAMPSTRTALNPHTGMPNFGAGLTVGGTVKPWGTRLGFLGAAQYANSQQTLREDIRIFRVAGDFQPGVELPVDPTPRVDYKSLKTTLNTAWSTLGLFKWKLSDDHRLSLTGLYTRDADVEARQLDGRSRATSGEAIVRNNRLRYQMRSIALTRLGGRHVFPGAKSLQVDWFGSFAQARLADPLLRDSLFCLVPGSAPVDPSGQSSCLESPQDGAVYLIDQRESGKFQFFDLKDNTATGSLDLTLPFKQWRQLDSKLKFGGWVEGKRRTFAARTFDYQTVGSTGLPIGTGEILTPDTIGGGPGGPGGAPFFLKEFTRADDSYRGDQRVLAGYAMLDLPIVRWLRVVGGARVEANTIDVRPFDRFSRPIPAEKNARVVDNNVLPAASLIFPLAGPRIRGDMNIRLSAAKTVARPEFRELAPFLFTDFVGGFDVTGYAGLRTTKIWNADLRWEWFPSADEVVALSAFYKRFDGPIERVIGARATPVQSYRNALSAQNIGAELELRKSLEFVHKSLRELSLGANFAYVYSQVDFPAYDPTDLFSYSGPPRPLEGQSPYVVNAYLTYINARFGTSPRVVYNAVGERIALVGGQGSPSSYVLPVHNLDLVVQQRLYRGFYLYIGAHNVLNTPYRIVQGEEGAITYNTRRGVTFLLGLFYARDRDPGRGRAAAP